MLVLFLFSRNILLALFAVITGMRTVQFPFKVFLPRDLPRMKFLLAQQPFLHELIDKTILEVHSHWLSDRPVETNLLLEINEASGMIVGGMPCLCRYLAYCESHPVSCRVSASKPLPSGRMRWLPLLRYSGNCSVSSIRSWRAMTCGGMATA